MEAMSDGLPVVGGPRDGAAVRCIRWFSRLDHSRAIMSFGRAMAAGCSEIAIRAIVFQLVVAFAAGACGVWLLNPWGYSTYDIKREDIELLKDAAAVIGPGDPIARELWRMAERIEGK